MLRVRFSLIVNCSVELKVYGPELKPYWMMGRFLGGSVSTDGIDWSP